MTVKDLGASRAFYVDMLGFIISDEDADTLYLRGLEEACHHSLVLKKATEAPRCERKMILKKQKLISSMSDYPSNGSTLLTREKHCMYRMRLAHR